MAKIALLVGISEYDKKQSGLEPLPSTLKDVEAMREVLEHPDKGGFAEVKVLTNPTKTELELAVYDLFAERNKDDLVLFYFSGHGVKDQNRNLYLTTPETRKAKRGGVVPPTAVAASYLHNQTSNSRSEYQVIILDCCFSGAIAKGLTAKDDGDVDLQSELGGKGRAILTSSSSVQSSFQQGESQLSIYTQYLVEGIGTGAADRDSDGRISADELHQYASEKVKEAAPAMTPQFYPVQEGYNIYLARAPQDDPKLEYRKEVEEVAREEDGEIGFINRRCLEVLRRNLGLSVEETNPIEHEVLEPYRQRHQKLQEYEDALAEALEKHKTLRARDRKALKRLQGYLGMTEEDVAAIEMRLVPDPPQPPLPKGEPVEDISFGQKDETRLSPERLSFPGAQPNQPSQLDCGKGVILELVSLQAGSLRMGSPEGKGDDDERPQHRVTVQPFMMGKYPVTQKQWLAVMGSYEREPGWKGDDLPIERVTWYEAKEFCEKLSQKTGREVRLPTEAEWEYACRAGSQTEYCFGDSDSQLGEYAWYGENSNGQTHPVGQKKPNAWGLHDLHGNVWEWCEDHWHENYQGAPYNSTTIWLSSNNNSPRLLRGGSWNYGSRHCRSAYRLRYFPGGFNYLIGFRVVVSAPSTP